MRGWLRYAPALVYWGLSSIKWLRFRVVRAAIIGTLPLTAWFAFAIIYYGFPFPNTYYAKLGAAKQPLDILTYLGFGAYTNSWEWDPITHLTFIAAVASCIICDMWVVNSRSNMASISFISGVVLYLVYIFFNAASATHMSGRFFSTPFLIAAFVATYNVRSRQLALSLAIVALFYAFFSERSAFKFGSTSYAQSRDAPTVIDTKLAVYQEGTALRNYRRGMQVPNQPWYRKGLELRKGDETVMTFIAAGYFGFGAGPTKKSLDPMGLCDPLLARLPGKAYPNPLGGHFRRAIPAGYEDSMRNQTNVIVDPSLHEYYDIIREITRSPIFRWKRFEYIWSMNRGKYNYLIDEYMVRNNLIERTP